MVWVVYMMRCADGSLYTGVTTDVERRLRQHNDPKGGAKYTRARQPVALVYSEKCADRSTAQMKEAGIKKLSRQQKEALLH